MEYVIFILFATWALITIIETFVIIFRGKYIRKLRSENEYLRTIRGACEVLSTPKMRGEDDGKK